MTRRILIDPITRLEGHGKIDILLDDDGNVVDAYLQVVELRGFERFCEGRPVEELIRIMPKICGVCPGAHHMAAAKAADAVWDVTIPPAARKLRELFYNAHIAHSHILHFFALGAPDLLLGPDAPKAKRNILGLVELVGRDVGVDVFTHRGYAQRIQGMIAGHPIHPVAALPGGMSKPLAESDRDEIEQMGASLVAFGERCLALWDDAILGRRELVELVTGDTYRHETYYAGLVDPDGKVNFYDGQVRVVAPDGSRFAQYEGADYLDHIAERVEPWSYLKLPYLKQVGWAGLVDGPDSGVYRVNSLARLNVADGLATPRAQAAYERMVSVFGGKPIHHTLAFHWARLVELMFATEEVLRLATDPEITSPDVRVVPTARPGEGVGVVEAARGTLFHHYVADSRGIARKVNLIVATAQNNAAMNLSVKKVAQATIRDGHVDEGILDRIEMAFRAYDPCLACATHTMPGQMPLEVRLHHPSGEVLTLRRNLDHT
ncbi:MAG: Ni/Fe hydrogenase subunit alpha [Deltaproteobacteria bacterium]|nr:Ni/Fe hydrogenase subunit alpha [Deltaproteobacteria bacterium]